MVSAVRADNGIGGQNRQTHMYEGLKAHIDHGSLGFAKMTVVDDGTGIVTESEYSQDFANNTEGLMVAGRTIAPDLTVLEETTTTWAAQSLHHHRRHAALLPLFAVIAGSKSSNLTVPSSPR